MDLRPLQPLLSDEQLGEMLKSTLLDMPGHECIQMFNLLSSLPRKDRGRAMVLFAGLPRDECIWAIHVSLDLGAPAHGGRGLDLLCHLPYN